MGTCSGAPPVSGRFRGSEEGVFSETTQQLDEMFLVRGIPSATPVGGLGVLGRVGACGGSWSPFGGGTCGSLVKRKVLP